MSAPQRILFVNRFYWPDEPATAQLLTDLAEALVVAGHPVSVIASAPQGRAVPKEEIRRGVQVIRVSTPRFAHRCVLFKAIAFLLFSIGALRIISRLLIPNDVLVVMTDPPLLGIPATWIARRRGAAVVHWVQDVYPEIAITIGGIGLAHIFRSSRDRAWKNAAACVALGQDMAALLRSRGVAPERITISPNWAPAGLVHYPSATPNIFWNGWGLVGKFVVMYSGNLGRVHDLEPIILVARALQSEKDIVFLFVGDGAQKSRLQTLAAERGLTNIVFQPAQPREKLGQTLALADLHLITLRAGCEQLVFPSKLYGITAIGRPVLFIGPEDCELSQMIMSHAFGFTCGCNNLAPAVTAIHQLRDSPEQCALLGKAAEEFYRRAGGLESSVAIWTALLSRLTPLAERPCTPSKYDQ